MTRFGSHADLSWPVQLFVREADVLNTEALDERADDSNKLPHALLLVLFLIHVGFFTNPWGGAGGAGLGGSFRISSLAAPQRMQWASSPQNWGSSLVPTGSGYAGTAKRFGALHP